MSGLVSVGLGARTDTWEAEELCIFNDYMERIDMVGGFWSCMMLAAAKCGSETACGRIVCCFHCAVMHKIGNK